ncbi:hypothetical protein PD885_02133 [Xanthomonas fragariae]|uniref:Uncharacterized protein n=1 Tax=Xanthomonas fragariae TaxID=48664 RepID=A0ABY1RQ11_9XANT|nr:hypothetical protein PD885_02133 [Xanthomonas fragariae]
MTLPHRTCVLLGAAPPPPPLYGVAPEKPQPPNDRKALMSAPACQNYQCSLR